MPIFIPQAKKNDDLGQALGIAQTVGGVMTGNPIAAAGGLASLSAQESAGKLSAPGIQTQASASSPMMRRMQMQQEDPLAVLAKAKESLAYQPLEIQKEYGSTIDNAIKMAQKSRNMSGVV